jgi:hypothetical protein
LIRRKQGAANPTDRQRPNLAGLYVKSQTLAGLQAVNVLRMQVGLRADIDEFIQLLMDIVDEGEDGAVAEQAGV